MKRGPGRPPVLDRTKKEVIVGMLNVGCSRAATARYVGCSPETLRNEAKRDAEFALEIRQAEANVELRHLGKLTKAADRSWRASAWLLERLNPQRFARRRARTLTEEQVRTLIEHFASVVVEELSPSDVRNRIQRRLEHLIQAIGSEPDPDEPLASLQSAVNRGKPN